METTNKIVIAGGYVLLKPFIDRKTMREYRKVIAHNSKTEPVLEDGKPKVDENGMPMSRVVIDPGQMDASNDALVRGVCAEAFKGENKVEMTDEFFDSMSSDDFDKILDGALKLMKKKEKEKKS